MAFTSASSLLISVSTRLSLASSIPGTKSFLWNERATSTLSFLMKLRGRRGTFKAGDQDRKTIQGATVGTVLVNGAGQTGNSINVDGVGATVTGAFKAGDYITIQDRLYMVTDDANSNGSGEATLYIEPALRSGILAIADDATVLYTNTTALMRLDSNEQNWDTDHISKYGISFSFSEAL